MLADSKWDLIVVGAGPAGSAAAYFAAQLGLRTLLLERYQFPRDKTCGDGVGAGGAAVLSEMGIYDQLSQRGAGLATGFGFGGPSGGDFRRSGIVFESSLRPEPLLIVPRRELDEACAHAASAAGAELRERQRVRGPIRQAGRVCGVELESGEKLSAPVLIGADGVHSCIARALGMLDDSREHRAFAVRTYYRDVKNLGADVFFVYDENFLPAYFWAFPLADGRANVGVGRFDRYIDRSAEPLTRVFERFVRENKLIRHLLEGGRAEAKLRGWPLRLGTSSQSGVAPGAMLCGDANGFIDPLTGEGIHFALRSGQLAAEVAAKALGFGDVSAAQLNAYSRAWHCEFDDAFRWGDRVQRLLMAKPALCDGVVELGRKEKNFAGMLGEVFSGVRSKRDLMRPGTMLQIAHSSVVVRLRGVRQKIASFS